jgi:hypothetical protein
VAEEQGAEHDYLHELNDERARKYMRIPILAALVGVAAMGVAQDAAHSSPQSTAQSAQQSSVLVVTGHSGQAPVIHRNGRWYVDVEGLARMTGATLAFQGSRIVLALPATAAAQPPVQQASAPARPPEEKGFTREFLRAGVEQMTVIREWRSAIENAVRTNNPVEESWVSYYRRTANDRMSMATAAATTESDRRGIGLLQSEMGMIGQLSDRFLALRSNLTFVATTALDNDPLDQKILACAQGMAAMAIPGGMFEDVAACH